MKVKHGLVEMEVPCNQSFTMGYAKAYKDLLDVDAESMLEEEAIRKEKSSRLFTAFGRELVQKGSEHLDFKIIKAQMNKAGV